MKAFSLSACALILGGCSALVPPVPTPEASNPQSISSAEWIQMGGNSAYAHRRAVGDGIVVAWVRTDATIRRSQRNGEPNRSPAQRQSYVWLEVDCDDNRYRESHHREYADAQLVPTNARSRSVSWEPIRYGNSQQHYLCRAGAEPVHDAT